MTSKTKHKRQIPILFLFITSLFSACDEQSVVYHSYHSLPESGWLYNDTLYFDAEIEDSLTSYQLSIEVRHRRTYPYQNLPLTIYCLQPDSIQQPIDTLNLTIADTQGNWQGRGIGGLYQYSLSAGRVLIHQSGIYRFSLTHALPNDTLYGICDIGIKITK